MRDSVYFALQFYGELAQSVEQRIENPRVPSSILGLATTFFTSDFLRVRGFLFIYTLFVRDTTALIGDLIFSMDPGMGIANNE